MSTTIPFGEWVTASAGDDLREVVARVFHAFGEDRARGLAERLGVRFEDCRNEINRAAAEEIAP